MSKHKHVWGPKTGIGRLIALAIAKGWPEMGPLVCVVCGKRKGKR